MGQLLPGLDIEKLEVVSRVGVTCLGRLIPLGSCCSYEQLQAKAEKVSWKKAGHGHWMAA